MTRRVLVDSNVLASRIVLDWIYQCRVHNEGMFQLFTTEDIKAEVIRVLRKRNPRRDGGAIADRARKIAAVMDEVLEDFPGDLNFTGTDEGDYHVHAAAVVGNADLVVTLNKPHDITTTPDEESYELITPDDFLILVTDSNPRCLQSMTKDQFSYWAPRGRGQLDDGLRRAGCQLFAERVRQALRTLA